MKYLSSLSDERNWSKQEIEDYIEEQESFGKTERIVEAAIDAKIQESIQQNQIKTAINLLKMGLPLKTIAQGTELSIAEIEQLKNQLKNKVTTL